MIRQVRTRYPSYKGGGKEGKQHVETLIKIPHTVSLSDTNEFSKLKGLENKLKLESKSPAQRAEGAIGAMNAYDKEALDALWNAFEKERNPWVASVIVMAYAVVGETMLKRKELLKKLNTFNLGKEAAVNKFGECKDGYAMSTYDYATSDFIGLFMKTVYLDLIVLLERKALDFQKLKDRAQRLCEIIAEDEKRLEVEQRKRVSGGFSFRII